MTNFPSKTDNKDIAVEPTTDLSEQDLAKVRKFEEEGLPGVASLSDGKLAKITDLYLNGKTYRQIAAIVSVPRTLVMYLSNKFGWYIAKSEYLHELDLRMRDRVIESKLVNQDFLLQVTHMYRAKIGEKIAKFLATGDSSFANEIDPKEINQYLKTIEVIHKLNGEGGQKSSDKPTVGLNLGGGVTIKKVGDNQVEITPKEVTVGNMLKQFADYRREEDNKSKTVKYEKQEVVTENEVNEGEENV